MGLGLALVRSLTEGHGEHVELESEVREDSVFSVYLPVD
jgi:signal transduction histidine kinase